MTGGTAMIKRYARQPDSPMDEKPRGQWVLYRDHVAEVNRLSKRVFDLEDALGRCNVECGEVSHQAHLESKRTPDETEVKRE